MNDHSPLSGSAHIETAQTEHIYGRPGENNMEGYSHDALTSHPSSRRWAWLGKLASAALLMLSVGVIWKLSHEIEPAEVMAAFAAASREQLSLAISLTAISYLLLTGYDALALRQLGLKMSYFTTALASFTSYAVSFNLGFPLVTGGTVRYWIYAPRGLSAANVASLTVIAGLTFWLGMGAVLGYCLIKESVAVSEQTGMKASITVLLGIGAYAIVICYLVWVSLKRRIVSIQGWKLQLPGLKLSLAQMILGIGDVCAAAGVLYCLLPAGHGVGFESFLAIYVAAVMLGIASHSPGGVGVFEVTLLLALAHIPQWQMLGSLLLFRLIYYLIPFVVSLICLGAYEISNRFRSMAGVLRHGDGR